MGATAAVHPTDPILQAYGLGKLDDASADIGEQAPGSLRFLPAAGCRAIVRRIPGTAPDRPRSSRTEPAAGWPPSAASSTEGGSRPVVSPPPVDTLPPELVDHPDYEIVRELGRGGMGVVYLAQNKLMGRLEVLKVVGRHLVERPGVARPLPPRDPVGRQAATHQYRHRLLGHAARREPRAGHGVRRGARPGEDGQDQAARCRWPTPATSSTRRRWACSTPTSAAWSTATSSRPT